MEKIQLKADKIWRFENLEWIDGISELNVTEETECELNLKGSAEKNYTFTKMKTMNTHRVMG